MPTQTLRFPSPRHLSQLYCNRPANLAKAENAFHVRIEAKEDTLTLEGDAQDMAQAADFFELLNEGRAQGLTISDSDFTHTMDAVQRGEAGQLREIYKDPVVLRLKRASIVPKTLNQKRYLQFIQKNDIVFGIGPAGTGKTYLAVATAVEALTQGRADKIILTRPAVEAGEALGFLPGDLQEKILPYLRPLYDALHDMLGQDETAKLMEKGVIEIAPLAYMRGRTLSNAHIILDEAQNTTPEQMMMFLTRLGDRARMTVTGDITQVDLPQARSSGLRQAIEVLRDVEGIKLFYFEQTDVVRHPLVGAIIEAYERYRAESPGESRPRNGRK